MNLEPLVVAAAAGDVDAFGRLVSATSALVSSIALAIVRDLDLSKDVSQDVFLAAWRDLRTLRNPSSFLPWLRQMTRNRAHHTLRTRIRSRRREGDSLDEVMLEAVADPRPTAADALVAVEDGRALAEALESLPDETREIVLLYYREDRSAKQVAALLDLSEDAVKKRLSRARAALRETLLERTGDLLRRTAPGAAFTSAVVATALSIGAPSTAAAATTMAASKASGASGGAGLIVKVAAALGGAALGGAAGVAGVVFGVRQLVREARDDEERQALKKFGAAASAVVIVAAAMFPISWALAPRAWTQIAVFGGFIVTLMVMYLGWLPRILARRMAAEMREDPERALRRRVHERRMQLLGWTLGVLSGTAGLLYGLWSSGAFGR
jgi:RNA polymerase sigma factor (sigma-70 family)